MALPTLALQTQGRNFVTFLASSAADADTGEALIAHNLPAVPDIVILEEQTAAGTLAQYSVTTRSATQIGVTKNGTGAGSGGADQVRVVALLLHSIQR